VTLPSGLPSYIHGQVSRPPHGNCISRWVHLTRGGRRIAQPQGCHPALLWRHGSQKGLRSSGSRI